MAVGVKPKPILTCSHAFSRAWCHFIRFVCAAIGQNNNFGFRITTLRAAFNWVSKVILILFWFCFSSLCDWLKNLAPLSRPIRSETQTNHDLPARVFPRLAPVASSSDWFIGSFVFVVTGWANYFGFGFTELIWKALYCRKTTLLNQVSGKPKPKCSLTFTTHKKRKLPNESIRTRSKYV